MTGDLAGQNLDAGAIYLPRADAKNGVPARRQPGGAGQNARLAAKLTGFKIDIKPASNPGPDEPKEDAAIAEDAGADEE